mgnify:FL=1
MFADSVRYCVLKQTSQPETLKEAAKELTLNKIALIINTLYEVSELDDYTCYKSIAFYSKVRSLILKM